MSTAQTLEIYKLLQKHFKDDEDATRFVSDIQIIIDNKFEDKKSELATKEDLNNLREDMNGLKVELVTRIEASKADNIKWMFIFWIGQLAATTGVLFAILNAYLRK